MRNINEIAKAAKELSSETREVIELLEALGVFEYMSHQAIPRDVGANSVNYVYENLVELGRARGYAQAYDELLRILHGEVTEQSVQMNNSVKPTFGARAALAERGIVKQEGSDEQR